MTKRKEERTHEAGNTLRTENILRPNIELRGEEEGSNQHELRTLYDNFSNFMPIKKESIK